MTIFKLTPKYYFGIDALSQLPNELKLHNYKKAMILYGGGSVKKNGIFDDVVKHLNTVGLPFVEFGGIEPNPHHSTINKAAELGRNENVDLIIAVGGGSVIDSSKPISIMISNPQINDSWDIVLQKADIKNLPVDIFSVITLAGTGSENNSGFVVTNEITLEKEGILIPETTPKVAFEDPKYLLTLSEWQTSSGIYDCFTHLLEQFYAPQTFLWTDEYIIANMLTLFKATSKVLQNKSDLEAKANILWTTSFALNGLAMFDPNEKYEHDFIIHMIEHALSAKYDVTHGAGLALITPSLVKYRSSKDEWFKQRTLILAQRLFNVNSVDEFVSKIIEWIKELNLPIKYTDFKEISDISNDDIMSLAEHTIKFSHTTFTKDDVINVLKMIEK